MPLLMISSCWLPDDYHGVLVKLILFQVVEQLLLNPTKCNPLKHSIQLCVKCKVETSHVAGHPCRMKVRTCDKTGSTLVHLLMFEAFMVVVERWFKRCTRSPGKQSASVVTGRLNASVFPKSLPDLWWIVKVYILKVNVHLMSCGWDSLCPT